MDSEIIYLISDSPWVIPFHVVPKKGGMIVVTNEKNELIPTRTVTMPLVIISPYLLLIKYSNVYPVTFSIVSYMAFQVIFKFILIQETKRRPHTLVQAGPLLIVKCPSVYATHQPLFKDA